jgi:hypothetical protein
MVSKWIDENGNRMKCHVEDCCALVHTAGLCSRHYYLAKYKGVGEMRGGSTTGVAPRCRFDGCVNAVRAKGLCCTHREQEKRGDPLTPLNVRLPCRMVGCADTYTARSPYGLCKAHAQDARRYSLTGDQLLALWENPVCSNEGCGSTERLHVDHDHSCCPPDRFRHSNRNACGKCVRGLLCQPCNLALGHAGESVERLRGLIAYLENAKPAAEAEATGRASGTRVTATQ